MTSAVEIIEILSKAENAQHPLRFPIDSHSARHAGMYAWWADDTARSDLGRPLGLTLPPLIYVGQAGATRWPSGTPSGATLRSRIGQQHIRGNARSSTFRLTVSALLWSSGRETLGVIVYSLQEGGDSPLAAAVSVVAIAIVLGLMALADIVGRRLPPGALPWRG